MLIDESKGWRLKCCPKIESLGYELKLLKIIINKV